MQMLEAVLNQYGTRQCDDHDTITMLQNLYAGARALIRPLSLHIMQISRKQ